MDTRGTPALGMAVQIYIAYLERKGENNWYITTYSVKTGMYTLQALLMDLKSSAEKLK